MIQSIPLWLVIVLIVFGIAIAFLCVAHIILQKKLRQFMGGKDGKSLEATLEWLTKKHVDVDETLQMHKKALEFIDNRVKKSIRGYSLVRYDAYENAGGNQSFASGIIDEYGDGYVLSVITNRSHIGIYAKPIQRGSSLTSLTEEESLALSQAKKNL